MDLGAAMCVAVRTPARLALACAAVVVALCLFVGVAQAATTTVGDTAMQSNSPAPAQLSAVGAPVFQGDATAGSYVLSSPVAGTVTSWSFLSGGVTTGNRFLLQVLRPDTTGTQWTAVAASATQSVQSPTGTDGLEGPFTTSLPIQAGDRIALVPETDQYTPIETGVVGQDGVRWLDAPLAAGSTGTVDPASAADNGQIVPVQATVQYATGPPPPPPPPPATPPTASLSAQLKAGRLELTAASSHPNGSRIVGYRVSLSNLPGQVIACGQDSPVVRPVFSKAVAGTATLTVLAANGTSSTASTKFSGPGVAPLVHAHGARDAGAPAHGAGVGSRLIGYQCLPKPGSPAGLDPVPSAGGLQISSACEVDAGVVQVDGCGLQPVSDLCSGVPKTERLVLQGHMAKQAGVGSLRAALGPCGQLLSSALLGSLASASSRINTKSYLRLADAFWVSTQPVRVNGIDISPKPGSAIVLASGGLLGSFKPFSAYLVSSGDDVALGGLTLPVSSHRLNLDVSNATVLKADSPCPNGSALKDLPLGQFSLQNPFNLPTLLRVVNEQNPGTPLASIPQLPITGALSVALGAGGTGYLSLNVALNRVLDDPADPDGNFTGCTVLTTSNHKGVDVSHFEINAPQVDIGVQIQFKFVYDQPTRRFSGSLAVSADSLGGQIGGAVDFLNGVFQDAAANYTANPGGGYPIGGGFFIIKVDGKFYLFQRAIPGSQTAIDADMRISLGPAVDNNGCGLLDVEGKTRLVFYPGPFSVDSVGALELYCTPVFNRYFHADAAGHVEVGMSASLDAGPISLSANIDGQAFIDLAGTSRVQLDASGTASIDFGGPIGTHTVSLDGSISDRGAGFCASVNTPLHTFQVGLGESFIPPPVNQLIFLHNLSVMADGCDLSQYRTLAVGGPPQGLARDARRLRYFTLNAPASGQSTVVALQGRGGPPSVRLRGPGGRTIDTATNSLSSTELVLRQPSTGATLVELAGAPGGRWSLTPDPGSPPVVSARTAQTLPRPSIRASVTGSGSSRVLHYAIGARPGMRVTFLERGKRGSELIGVAHGRRGSIRFVPSSAASGTREIIAAISQNGMPSPSIVVARYRASRPLPGRVSRIAYRYQRGGLLISFRAARLATAYTVSVELSDGRGLRLAVSGRRTSLFVPRVSSRTRVLRISVVGVRGGLAGPRVVVTPRRR